MIRPGPVAVKGSDRTPGPWSFPSSTPGRESEAIVDSAVVASARPAQESSRAVDGTVHQAQNAGGPKPGA
jgi:hypothetical protein